ncbi:MAG: CPBP family intramembrane glutamic endopeptidase [Blastococcus sp.]
MTAPALLERTVLDQQVAAARRVDLGPWGLLSWLGPLLTLAATIVAGNLVVSAYGRRHPDGRGAVGLALSVGGDLLLLAALVAFGHQVAARAGGWRAALGLDRIRRSDWLPWITGVGFVFIGRNVVGGLANALTGGKATAQASNVHVGDLGLWSIAVLVVLAVVVAPVAEELMFRGLLLRTFMRRLSFWPAALLSTALFAAFHLYEVHTLVGAVTLACSIAVLGLCNCYLVRISGRLAPAIMVHATNNAIALAIAVAVAR